MAAASENLTQEEIWDDSALVESWNAALQEYKKYHSIHTKGGNVHDLLEASKPSNSSDAKQDEQLPDAPIPRSAAGSDKEGLDANGRPKEDGAPSSAERSAFIPAPLLASVRDESLKKLLMSWYYAGYYTGYYEGQQAQQQ